MNDGKYAELITEIATRIYLDDIEKIVRNYRHKFKSGVNKEIDVCVFLKNGKKIAFEVRDRAGNQSSRWTEQVFGKYSGEEFDYVWVCTFGKCSLARTAIKELDYRKIGWRNININGDYHISDKPIIQTEAIQILPEEIRMTINGEEYRELKAEGIDENGKNVEIDLKEAIIQDIKNIIENKFDIFDKTSFFEHNIDLRLSDIETNLNKGENKVVIKMPLNHITFCDYLSEKFEVEDYKSDNKENIIIASKYNSIFVTNKKLVIDLSYIGRLKDENTIINKNFVVNVEEIPPEYRGTNKIKFINMDGSEDFKVYKIVGYKN